ncbi:hypothetical protein FGO68_gene15657 [Halteria grandinella]|uniref:Uncharacterized protein n=1 Tax=Halteria grandinella TaxID=5974 RepID=A0A8J8SYN1_HALGN|nr:hypothetical protein FGO68_gene15657 [Halteria grandinella]
MGALREKQGKHGPSRWHPKVLGAAPVPQHGLSSRRLAQMMKNRERLESEIAGKAAWPPLLKRCIMDQEDIRQALIQLKKDQDTTKDLFGS